MIGIDTNILVRYLTQDDERQSEIASNFLESQCSSDNPGFLNDIVLCELIWVLEEAYGYNRDEIVPVLEQLLRTVQLRVSNTGRVWRATEAYRNGHDFSDASIADLDKEAGCSETVTFDKRASRLPTFRLLD